MVEQAVVDLSIRRQRQIGIRDSHVTLPFEPCLRVTRHAEGPHVTGREKYNEISVAGFSCTFLANSERKRVWYLIGQWTVHRLPTSLIGREAGFGWFRG